MLRKEKIFNSSETKLKNFRKFNLLSHEKFSFSFIPIFILFYFNFWMYYLCWSICLLYYAIERGSLLMWHKFLNYNKRLDIIKTLKIKRVNWIEHIRKDARGIKSVRKVYQVKRFVVGRWKLRVHKFAFLCFYYIVSSALIRSCIP